MVQKTYSEEPIVFRPDPVTKEQIARFVSATHSEHYSVTPLTFPTIFRAAEFKWLDRLHLELRELLHTDQEYEYFAPFVEGDHPTVITKVGEVKERRGMTFILMVSEVRCRDTLIAIARSSFVIRSQSVGGNP